MKLTCFLLAVVASSASSWVVAQGKSDYTLNADQVHFSVPPDWKAVMEKTDGNPQAIAFQVPDNSAQGSEDAASVTVKTRELANPAQFSVVVLEEFEHAKVQPGYEIDPSNQDTSAHHYFVVRGKTRYAVRDSFQPIGNIAVAVRCQRPLLAATPATWTTEFERSCSNVVASLKR